MTDKLISSVNNWKSLKPLLDLESNLGKGDTFELLTELYFKLNPKFENKYDDVWNIKDVPSKVLEKLGLPSEDLGIDLILRSGDEYHAVQCKYHGNKKQSVTFKEVSTFLTLLESTKKLSLGYICSTAELTSRNFKKLKTKQITPLLSDTWESLDEEFFSRAKALLKGKKKSLLPFKPRAHQTKALKQADKYFNKEKHTRGKLIFPCGAGKSLTGFWLTQKLGSKSTLIAVPSLSLVKQTLEVYLREIVAHKKKVKWLCICSDEGIGKNDDVVVYTQDLGVPCVTDPEYIENWLAENVNEEKVIFTTYQSGRIIAEISKKLNFTFDVGIFDEAHKTVGSDKKLFSHLLFSKNISIAKRIFMTATERFYEGSKDDIISMDDEDIYGDTFALMSFKEAIELQLLTDYKVITIDIQKSEIADFIRDNKLVQLNDKWKKETEARSLASMLALRKAMKRFNIKNAVSFHSSIEKARRNKDLQQHITDTYNYQPIDTFTVSGKDATTKRNDIVQEFAKSDKALITNARCLTEGVDVPNIDCIVFADPRKSRVDIVQALGRALRKKEGKEWGYVILPIIYDNTTNEIDNDNFNEILDVVRGLAANDERIVEYFKDKGEINTKAKKEVEEQFNFEVLSEYMDEGELSKQLEIKVWEKLSRFNWMEFEEAREFVQKLGIKTIKEWQQYYKSGKCPNDIPRGLARHYRGKGWTGTKEFFGTGVKEYLPIEKAKKIVRELGIKTHREWVEFCAKGNKPVNIPSSPLYHYRNSGWKDWGDWLGTDSVINFRSFEEARDHVCKLGLSGQTEYVSLCRNKELPNDIPVSPNGVYKNKGWKGWRDFLGEKKDTFLPFNDAREFAQNLNLNSAVQWRNYCSSGGKPKNIPSTPYEIYKEDGWKDWGDWLGTGRKSDFHFLDYSSAKKYVLTLNISSPNKWKEYCKSGKRPKNIPSSPNVVYKNKGWKGWRAFLSLKPKVEFVNFNDARLYARSLKLNGQEKWFELTRSGDKPENIPTSVQKVYKDKGWKGWKDFLGNDKKIIRQKEVLSFEKARDFAIKLKLKSSTEWRLYLKSGDKPSYIPAYPALRYKDEGWKGWKDFLGNDKKK